MEIIAHRYGNSVEGIEQVRGHADLVEVDAHLHGDRIEVRHAKRVWLTKRFWERWYLLPPGSEFSSLRETAGAAGDDVRFWVDCKGVHPELPDRVLEVLGTDRAVTFSTKSWWMLRSLEGRPGVRKVRSAGNKFELLLLRRLPSRVALDGVVLHRRLLTADLVAELRARFGAVYSWSVPDEAAAERLRSWGVAGVILDDLDLIKTIR